jgi:CubicO group peptidase (beta-lactamase class C family)
VRRCHARRAARRDAGAHGGKPEDVGLSSAQLKRLEAATKQNIDDGLMPGAVMLVARHGKVAWISVQGKRAPDSDDPMKFDSIFRIYSMTKPITSIALMQLVEEGKLQVSDPVAKYLPEIGKMKVGTEVAGPDGKPVLHLSDPDRAMTVQDLLRHTSGLTYGNRGTSLVHQAYVNAKISDRTAIVEEMVHRLSGVPLLFTPGARWEYSVAIDVQAARSRF